MVSYYIRCRNWLIILGSDGTQFGKIETTHQILAIYSDDLCFLLHDWCKKIDSNLLVILHVGGTAVATTDTDTSNTGSVTLNFAANQNFVLTLTGNVTLANPSTEK
jgi:hypothetical protein